MKEAKAAAERLVKYFETLGEESEDAQPPDYDPAEDARLVLEALED